MIINWNQYLSTSGRTPSQMLSQFFGITNTLKLGIQNFLMKIVTFLSQLFENGRIITPVNLKDEYESTNGNSCKLEKTNY